MCRSAKHSGRKFLNTARVVGLVSSIMVLPAIAGCELADEEATRSVDREAGQGVGRSPFESESMPTISDIAPGSQEDLVVNLGDRIFFGFDDANLSLEARISLQNLAAWLGTHPNVNIQIAGHADERGSRGYNLVLSERRANAALDYLVSLGIDAARVDTVSYGKERPAVLGSSEEVWPQNRRAVFVVEDRAPTQREAPNAFTPIIRTKRAPLWSDDVEELNFGLYSYLLFGSKSQGGRSRRVAAASGYLQLIPDTSSLTSDKYRASNVFYAPLDRNYYAANTINQIDAEWLECAYDYGRAKEFLLKIEEDGDGIYIVSYVSALDDTMVIDNSRLLVIDLSDTPENLIEDQLLEFRRQVRRERYWKQEGFRNFLLSTRENLSLVADSIAVVKGVITGKDPDGSQDNLGQLGCT